jgi:SSS family solute:Na+ symporter
VIAWHLGTAVFGVVPASVTGVVGDPVVPGVTVSVLVLVGISLLTEEPSRESTAQFFSDG